MSGKVRHLRPLPSFGIGPEKPAVPGEPIDAPGESSAAIGAGARRDPAPPAQPAPPPTVVPDAPAPPPPEPPAAAPPAAAPPAAAPPAAAVPVATPPVEPTPAPVPVQPAAQAPAPVAQPLPQPPAEPAAPVPQQPAAQAPAPAPQPPVVEPPAPAIPEQPAATAAPAPVAEPARPAIVDIPASAIPPEFQTQPAATVSAPAISGEATARVLEPELIPEPIVEPDPEPIAEQIPEPIVEPDPEPVAEQIPAPIADEAPSSIALNVPGLTPPQSRAHSGFVTDAIVALGFLTEEQIEPYIDQSRTAGRSPEVLLLEANAIDPEKLSRAVAERYGVDHVDLGEYPVDMGAVNTIPSSAIKRHNAAPVGYINESTLLIAVTDPTNVLAIDDIKMMTGLDCRVAVASPDDVSSLVGRLSTLDNAVDAAVEQDAAEAVGDSEELEGELESADDAPVIKLVYGVITQAAQQGASDIHFEVEESDMRVRFRVDGVLAEAATIPKRMMSGVVSRLKIMAELDIAEKRIPQDGRISLNIDSEPVDLRITTLPTQRGEGATIRILDKDQAMLSLDDLGMKGDARERFEKSFKKPYGCVLVTGPTGSGKSTSLYSALNELNQTERKIITIEDPVEFRVEGINQINVNVKAGLTFAAGLRSVLRADPDVVMVGEIRDGETARIAIEAALTGHMVLSTLHTNTAPGAVARMQKMGVESFLISSAVECVIAQRLARQLCAHCKKRTSIPQSALAEAGIRVGGDLEAYEPTGCSRCGRSGYKGRIGLYSVMVLSERLKDMITAGETESEIEKAAREEGMLTLREAGLEKIRAGTTSLEEIARVTV